MRSRTQFAVLLAAAVCLFGGFWAFVAQGYIEDAGSEPLTSWPVGVGFFLIAGFLIFQWVRLTGRPKSARELALIAIALVSLLALAALGSLDAGGNSFEF
jgi:succinate-acetate transporter protein